MIVNDFSSLFAHYPQIAASFFNGRTAEKHFMKPTRNFANRWNVFASCPVAPPMRVNMKTNCGIGRGDFNELKE
jgi:hypothetical protein